MVGEGRSEEEGVGRKRWIDGRNELEYLEMEE